jgi:hypothetical protein
MLSAPAYCFIAISSPGSGEVAEAVVPSPPKPVQSPPGYAVHGLCQQPHRLLPPRSHK